MTLDPILAPLDRVYSYIASSHDHHISRLIDYLRMPSISAHGKGMDEVAAYLLGWLERMGFDARRMPTAGWPMVLGRRFDAPGRPTAPSRPSLCTPQQSNRHALQ